MLVGDAIIHDYSSVAAGERDSISAASEQEEGLRASRISGRSVSGTRTAGSTCEDRWFFAERRLLDYLNSLRYFSAFPNRKVFPMNAPTIESLSAAARAGVTVIQQDGNTRRIRGAAASVGTSVIDVFFDPEHGTYVWAVDGIERSVDWVRWFLETE